MGSVGRPRGVGHGRLTLLLVAAVVVGLTLMHQPAGSLGSHVHAHVGGAGHAATAVGAAAHAVPCTHVPACPGHPHGQHGQACQAKPGSPTAPTPPQTAVACAVTAPSPAVTPSTAARDAAGGSGCGPPGRADLAVWRI